MTPKIFLVSAALFLACGSADAFNLGGLVQKAGSMVGDTECTASKCGNPNVQANTVNKCFMMGEEKIQRNPNCANAFFGASCGANSRNRAHFNQACQNVANALGKYYVPAKPAGANPHQQMRQQRPQVANHPQQMMQQRPQVANHPQQMKQQHPQQMNPAPQYQANEYQGGYEDQGGYGDQGGYEDQGSFGQDSYNDQDEYGQGGYDDQGDVEMTDAY